MSNVEMKYFNSAVAFVFRSVRNGSPPALPSIFHSHSLRATIRLGGCLMRTFLKEKLVSGGAMSAFHQLQEKHLRVVHQDANEELKTHLAEKLL